MSNGISLARVEEIINSYGCQRHQLIAIMQDVQAEFKYLSPPGPGTDRTEAEHRRGKGVQRGHILRKLLPGSQGKVHHLGM